MMKHTDSFAARIRPKHPSLTVVGSGITGLMTAWEAHKAGYDVTVISQSPDPRLLHDNDNPHSSSTFDSKNDQRYITMYEGHPYLELPGYVDAMYPGIASDFTKTTREGGVLAVPQESFREETREWLEKRHSINHRLHTKEPEATRETEALFASYADENRAALEKWHQFLQDILAKNSSLADSLSLDHSGIIRLYDTKEALDIAIASHQKDGVFRRSFTPQELAAEYPAYEEGVRNGFIQGGAILIYGLTLGVKSLGKAMIDTLETEGVNFRFNHAVETIELDENRAVTGLKLAGTGTLHRSKHYAIHPGAFATPTLFAALPEAQNQIAAMEGYWITLEGADKIVHDMKHKPNKIHGKQSLSTLLARLPEASQQRYKQLFTQLEIPEENYNAIAPIVDFNNMPIYDKHGTSLGIGSGYVFKGLPYADAQGKPSFTTHEASEKFTLTVMELWLEALHGKALLDTGQLVAHPVGCKRSWMADDRELDINYPTQDGGVMAIRAGGNTGDTTKSPFIAAYNIALMQASDKAACTKEELPEQASFHRNILRKTARDLTPSKWRAMEAGLNYAETVARSSCKIAR